MGLFGHRSAHRCNSETLPPTRCSIVTIAYTAIGLLVGSAFGADVASQCNLNWRQYVGCMAAPPAYKNSGSGSSASGTTLVGAVFARLVGGGGSAGVGPLLPPLPSAPACADPSSWSADCINWGARPVYATAISFVVLIFPALDVLSAFPLSAITLGNALMVSGRGREAPRWTATETRSNPPLLQSAFLGEAALAPPTEHEEHEYAASAPTRGLAAWLVPAASRLPLPPSSGRGHSESDADGRAETAAGADGVVLLPPVHGQGGGVIRRAVSSSVTGGGSRRGGGDETLPLVGAGDGSGADADADAGAAGEAAAAGEDDDDGVNDDLLALVSAGSAAAKPWFLRTRRGHRATKVVFRLLASVPPVVLCFFMLPLGTILQVIGGAPITPPSVPYHPLRPCS